MIIQKLQIFWNIHKPSIVETVLDPLIHISIITLWLKYSNPQGFWIPVDLVCLCAHAGWKLNWASLISDTCTHLSQLQTHLSVTYKTPQLIGNYKHKSLKFQIPVVCLDMSNVIYRPILIIYKTKLIIIFCHFCQFYLCYIILPIHLCFCFLIHGQQFL